MNFKLENKGEISIINLNKDKGKPYDIYIGRQNDSKGLNGSKWANPIRLMKESDRLLVLDQHEAYVRSRKDLIDALHELKGKTIACYCCTLIAGETFTGKVCHGTNLIKLFDEFVKED